MGLFGYEAPFVRRRGKPTFYPRKYVGPQYVFGLDPVGDMAALNACFNDAMNTPGSVACLDDPDHLGVPFNYLEIESGFYFNTWVRNIAYCHNLTRPIRIENTDSTLKLARMPVLYTGSTTAINWLHFGVGYDIAVDPGYNSGMTQAQIDAIWHYSNGYIIRGLKFDSSVLTPTNLARLSNSVTGGLIEFAGVGFPDSQGDYGGGALLENIHADISWGVIGIGSNARSNRLIFRNITFDQVYKVGMWVDGARDSILDKVVILGAHPSAVTPTGIGFEPNTDCFRGPKDNVIQNCSVTGLHAGFSYGGVNTTLQDCVVNLPAGATTDIGVYMGALANSNGVYPTTGGIIQRVSIQRDPAASNALGQAFQAVGNNNVNGYAPVDGTQIHDCTIGTSPKKIQIAFNLGPYVTNTNFYNNQVWVTSGTPILDTSSGHSSGNVFTPNAFH